MCGILGGISACPFVQLGDAARLTRAVDTLAHRGPDDRGELITADRCAFLGHRRLSIIDLGGGHQPIANESGDCHLCYNGEIYNFRALQDRVGSCGHTLRTRTDGEPALHLYEDDPRGFPTALAGMFAIAILDEKHRRLTLVRDRNGIKPLFYYHDGTTLIFASEIKAILAMLQHRPTICRHAVRQYLRWKYVPAPLTIYENIFKLLPAHLLAAKPDIQASRIEVTVSRYWDVDYGGPKITDEAEAIDMLDARLHDAVKSHMESDVEVGALLSGGVDSSLVTALACRVGGKPIKTFSVAFEEDGFDQLPSARKLAKKYGTEHFEEHVRLDPMEAVARLVRHFDEPFADSSALACFRVCEVAGRHVNVVLTGDGGDETFAGYNRYQEILDAAQGTGALDRVIARGVLATSGALLSPEAKYLKRFRAKLATPLEQHEAHQVLFSDWLANRLLMPEYQEGAADHDCFDELRRRGHSQGWQPMEVAQYVDLRMYLPDDILAKVDRTSMAHSLECRVPILDHSITEFSAQLATNLKIKGGIRKYLLKKVAERYVPLELLYRPKMGFRVPIRRWFKRDLLDQTASMLLSGALVSHGIVNPAGLQWMIRRQRRPWIDFGSHLWALLFFEQWAREYLVS